MFRGHSERNLDPKGRLMLPPEFREEVLRHSPEGKLMLTNFDDCVVGYPMPEWERIEESFQRINVLNAKLRNLQRFIISGAVEVALDKQGRILVPPYLRGYAKLDKDCILAGYSVFTPGPDAKFVSYTTSGKVQAYVQYKQPLPKGFERLGLWPTELFDRIAPPQPGR